MNDMGYDVTLTSATCPRCRSSFIDQCFDGFRRRSGRVQGDGDRLPRMGIRIWGHRFVLVGYVVAVIGTWMLVKKPTKAAFTALAMGATLQMVGGLLQH